MLFSVCAGSSEWAVVCVQGEGNILNLSLEL